MVFHRFFGADKIENQQILNKSSSKLFFKTSLMLGFIFALNKNSRGDITTTSHNNKYPIIHSFSAIKVLFCPLIDLKNG